MFRRIGIEEEIGLYAIWRRQNQNGLKGGKPGKIIKFSNQKEK